MEKGLAMLEKMEEMRKQPRQQKKKKGLAVRALTKRKKCSQLGHQKRHFKITCNALLRPDETELVFPLSTPAASGVPVDPGGRGTYKATVLGLAGRPAVFEPVHYSLEMAINFPGQEQKYSSYFLDMFHESKTTVRKMNQKFIDVRQRVKEKYPFFNAVPHVLAVPEPPNSQIYQMLLPPNSGFFCNDAHMWAALRFPAKTLLQQTVLTRGGGTAYRYGYANYSRNTLIISSAQILVVTDYPSVMYALVTTETPTKNIGIEVEFFLDSVPQTLAEKKTLDSVTAGEALRRLVATGLLLLNMEPMKLVVNVDTPGRIVLISTAQPVAEARVDLTLRLTTPLKDYFLLDSPTLTFPGNVERAVTLMHREPAQQDVLAGRYPLHLLAPGRADSHHFVHTFGWVSLLGVLAGPNKIIGAPEWLELKDGDIELRLILVDRWCRLVTINFLSDFYLNLELVADLF